MKKKGFVSIILALATVVFGVFGVACSKNNVDYSDVYGVYYAETADGEIELVLSEDGFTFATASDTEKGDFSYDGKRLALSFKGETDKTEAVIEDNVLTFRLKGVNYALYKKIEYTVSFVVGEETIGVKVINGKRVTKIADPVRNGYAFVGWYEDSAFTVLCDFNIAVTSNKTVYGRFVEVADGERTFTVTFYDGAELIGTKATIGRRIYDAPVAVREGKTFLGWWVSDYQSADKLTYKYEGQPLDSDTNFYAVYEEKGAIAVSVDSKKISWTSAGVNKNYSVSVTLAGEEEGKSTNVGGTSYNYDFATVDAGDYIVKVTVDGKTYNAYYKNKALARVCGFEVVDTFVLSYAPVENAKKYYITVVCGNEAHDHDRIDNGVSTNYNFSNCEMSEAGIRFIVEAEASGYAASVSDVFVVKRTLDAVEDLVVDEASDIVTWKAVKDATNYVIEITSDGATKKITVNTTGFSCKTYDAGAIKIKVTAIAKGYNASASTETSYDKKHVATPGNVKLVGKELSFDAVKGVTGYVVKIGSTEKTIEAGNAERITFTLTDDCFVDGDGAYSVSVKAKGSAADKDSIYSDVITVIIGDETQAAAVTYSNGEATWTQVYSARSYVVKLNGVTIATVADGALSAKIVFSQAGENTIEVLFVTAGGTVKSLASVKVTAYAINFNAQGGDSVSTVYKAVGDEVIYPATILKGYEFRGWFNAPDGASAGVEYADGVFDDRRDVTLYASWLAKKYNVILNYGEAGNSETTEVTFGKTYTITVEKTSSDLTKNFLGWFSQPNAQGTRYTDERGNSLDAWDYDETDRTFYAAWIVVFTFNEIDNGRSYSVSKATTANSFAELTVPATYNGKPVTTVEGSAFRGCLKLTTVNIPDTVKLIETGTAFLNCVALRNVNIYETGSRDVGGYSSVDGVLIYDNVNNGVELKYFPQSRSGEYVIPDVVETIPVAIFKSSKLTKVVIPASVTAIDANAFYYSRKLEEVVFEVVANGGKEKDLVIGANAFGYCQALTSISLPSRIKNFNSNIFDKSTNLESVDIIGAGGSYVSKDGVVCNEDGTQIIYCPVGRTGEYTVPSGVSSIGENAFYGCYKLTSLIIPGYVTEISKGAFSGCTYLVNLTFKGEKTDATLVIGEQAFYGCSYLTSVTLPENLSVLKKNAFGNTRNLVEVTVKCGEATFENAAFGSTDKTPVYYVETLNIGKDFGIIDITGVFGGTTLATVSVADENRSYSVIDNVIFDKAVTKIVYYPMAKKGDYVIPATVTEIGANVFENKEITKITIGKNIEVIGDFAFLNCDLLTEIVFEAGEKDLVIGNSAFSGTKFTAITLPARTVELGSNAFENCIELVEVSVPAKVTAIGAETFNGCEKLTTVTLSEGLTSVGDAAFANCDALTSITIPASVTSLGTNKDGAMSVFASSKALASVIVASENEKYASVDGVIYEKNAAGTLVTVLYCPIANAVNGGTFTVPASVTLIATGAFESNAGIKKVTFAGSSENFAFGSKVFNGCVGLKEVELPSGLKEIGASLFENCASIESIVIPNTVTSIGVNAFRMCIKLSSVMFEAGGEEALVIEDGKMGPGTPPTVYGAFVGCTALTSIELPERTTRIGAFAFAISDFSGPGAKAKTGLTSIDIPASVTSIGNYAFYATGAKANAFTSVNFASGSKLETIGEYAFAVTANFGFSGTSFTLPANVKTIGGLAFSGCSKLVNFVIGDNSKLETIGAGAFSSCASLTSFEAPSTVKTIGSSAFERASKLATFTFAGNSSIGAIGDNAFSNTALSTFTFPTTEGDIMLGARLFQNCTKLKTVNVSKSVTTVNDAFDGCSSITSLVVDAASKNAKVENSILLSKDDKYFYYILDIPADGTLTIPDGVESIDSYALSGKTALKKVIISESVRTIGNYAFSGCINLAVVEFAERCELETIGLYAFEKCTSLASLMLPSKLTTIENYAFTGCSSLDSVIMEDSVTSLGNYLFQNCTSLKTFEFPIDVQLIPNYCFTGCSSLKSVTYRGEVTTIGTYCFQKCTSLESMAIPESVSVLGVNTIANGYAAGTGGVFEGCTSLRSVTLPSNLSVIAGATFKNCSSLETVSIPETVVGIGIEAFSGCTKINNLVIPDGVKIGNGTFPTSNNAVFKNCTSLSNITFNGTLNYIGKECFAGCTALETIVVKGVTGLGNSAFASSGLRSIVLPDSLKTITKGAFSKCLSLEEITIPASVTSLEPGAFEGCTALKTVDIDERNVVYKSSLDGKVFSIFDELVYCPISTSGKVVMGEGETLAAYAFSDCKEITEVVLSEGTTEIPDYAFQNCVNLISVTIPDTVKRIGKYAFSGCSLFTFSSLPAFLETIDNYALHKCTSVTEAVLLDKVKTIGSSVFLGCTNLTKVVIPEGVETVGTSLFSGCTALTDVTLPSTLTAVSNGMFSGCSALANVTLPSKLTQIGSKTFEKCTSLTSIVIPDGIIKMGGNAFEGCSGLVSVTIGKGIESIPSSSFKSCSALANVVIPDSLISIEGSAFYGCKALTNIVIPAGVTTIGASAFNGCTGLTSIVIPDKLTTIGATAFSGCTKLASVTLGKGCESLPANLFKGCTSLKAIALPSAVKTVTATTFSGCTITVTVPYAGEEELPEGLATLLTAKGVTVAYTSEDSNA